MDDGVIYVELRTEIINPFDDDIINVNENDGGGGSKAGRKVEIGSNKEQTLKNIEEAIKYGYKKYESSIESCPNGFLSEGIK